MLLSPPSPANQDRMPRGCAPLVRGHLLRADFASDPAAFPPLFHEKFAAIAISTFASLPPAIHGITLAYREHPVRHNSQLLLLSPALCDCIQVDIFFPVVFVRHGFHPEGVCACAASLIIRNFPPQPERSAAVPS